MATLTAAPAVVPLLDGRPLAVWAYNGQVPGPVLRVRLGETLRVTLVNGSHSRRRFTGTACGCRTRWTARPA